MSKGAAAKPAKTPHIRWTGKGLRAEGSILKVFAQYRDDAMIAMPTGTALNGGGYLLVLDLDRRNGGEEALDALTAEQQDYLESTVTDVTPNGVHYWLRTDEPVASMVRPDGLELKGTGSLVVVPPGPGRYWLRSPFEWEILPSPDWLMPSLSDVLASESRPEMPACDVIVDEKTGVVGVDISGLCRMVETSPKGNRSWTLLRAAGKAAYFSRNNLLTGEEAKERLTEAALRAGLRQRDIHRIISWPFRQEGRDSHYNPAYKKLVVTPLDVAVLRRVNTHFGWKVPEASDVVSCRWLCEGVPGLRYPMQAKRSLDRLVEHGLLWEGSPKLIRTKGNQYRPARRFRATRYGLKVAGMELETAKAA